MMKSGRSLERVAFTEIPQRELRVDILGYPHDAGYYVLHSPKSHKEN